MSKSSYVECFELGQTVLKVHNAVGGCFESHQVFGNRVSFGTLLGTFSTSSLIFTECSSARRILRTFSSRFMIIERNIAWS